MRILLVPFITQPRTDAAYNITRCLISTLTQKRNAVAVNASEENGFRNISLYPSVTAKGKRVRTANQKKSYEQWLASMGGTDEKYLIKDAENIRETIDHFRPDLIISIDRIAAIAAARQRHIPCWTVTSSAACRNVEVAPYMKSINRFLVHEHMEQVFTLKDLYDTCEQRLVFGPSAVQPMPADTSYFRIGLPCIRPLETVQENRIFVDFGQTGISAKKLHSVLKEAFSEGSYDVRARYPECGIENCGRIRILPAFREDLFSGSAVMIHDGNAWMTLASIARGIPQIIVSDTSYMRSWYGQMAERCGIGVRISEKDLTAERLVHSVDHILSHPMFKENCMRMKKEAESCDDLMKIYALLDELNQ